jgi:hypothetical protein
MNGLMNCKLGNIVGTGPRFQIDEGIFLFTATSRKTPGLTQHLSQWPRSAFVLETLSCIWRGGQECLEPHCQASLRLHGAVPWLRTISCLFGAWWSVLRAVDRHICIKSCVTETEGPFRFLTCCSYSPYVYNSLCVTLYCEKFNYIIRNN